MPGVGLGSQSRALKHQGEAVLSKRRGQQSGCRLDGGCIHLYFEFCRWTNGAVFCLTIPGLLLLLPSGEAAG
jgi:hypothetical protein